ncbi:hypothetical protein [uncultured Duncaniella sp.]|uniref:hypothetical protein n=1 Tax=uncultured Duncaniella sp. TaxID=2768039 RepID=UPI00272B95BA|nr:hypothetical protein [uncultured Duncaniella sp.]
MIKSILVQDLDVKFAGLTSYLRSNCIIPEVNLFFLNTQSSNRVFIADAEAGFIEIIASDDGFTINRATDITKIKKAAESTRNAHKLSNNDAQIVRYVKAIIREMEARFLFSDIFGNI